MHILNCIIYNNIAIRSRTGIIVKRLANTQFHVHRPERCLDSYEMLSQIRYVVLAALTTSLCSLQVTAEKCVSSALLKRE